MIIENCSHQHYLYILENIEDFWGSDRTLAFHHPMYVYEFGNTSFVIKEKDEIIAYLFGFISQTEPVGYIHLAGVKQKFQKRGLGSKLYTHFAAIASQHGCVRLKAITTSTNETSIGFHKKIGMKMLGEKNENNIEVIKDYSGKGMDRVVFIKDI
jgi:GNAT superfamily N-acetyltransferase